VPPSGQHEASWPDDERRSDTRPDRDLVEEAMANVVMLIRHAEKPLGEGPPFGVTDDGVVDPESLTPR